MMKRYKRLLALVSVSLLLVGCQGTNPILPERQTGLQLLPDMNCKGEMRAEIKGDLSGAGAMIHIDCPNGFTLKHSNKAEK